MVTKRPKVHSRLQRLLMYLRHNRSLIAVDVTLLVAWIIGASAVFTWFALPSWLYYITLFTGVIVYSRITPTWERPYRSPD